MISGGRVSFVVMRKVTPASLVVGFLTRTRAAFIRERVDFHVRVAFTDDESYLNFVQLWPSCSALILPTRIRFLPWELTRSPRNCPVLLVGSVKLSEPSAFLVMVALAASIRIIARPLPISAAEAEVGAVNGMNARHVTTAGTSNNFRPLVEATLHGCEPCRRTCVKRLWKEATTDCSQDSRGDRGLVTRHPR